MHTLLDSEFNSAKSKRGKGTISDSSSQEAQGRKAQVPLKVDCCDSCAIYKKDIQSK